MSTPTGCCYNRVAVSLYEISKLDCNPHLRNVIVPGIEVTDTVDRFFFFENTYINNTDLGRIINDITVLRRGWRVRKINIG